MTADGACDFLRCHNGTIARQAALINRFNAVGTAEIVRVA